MLYQPASPSSLGKLARRVLGVLGAILASLSISRADQVYLDGMRDGELEDLNLRRTASGVYRPFE
ncbi:MAG: hypothetical protein EOP19_27585 [Hyphomicrobiales bacterium]|nr:MAG: hypothetical protein EOP19_27585 [Hyphomicrobiales bacterium]